METLLINVPEQKSTLVKQLLKELGVTIQNQTKARKLAEEINQGIKPGPKPNIDEIVAEVKAYRSEQ
jgi:ABC-type hemin transport system substrate-binding protein